MKQIDELIRGEMSAVKSIDTILNKVKSESEKGELNTIRQDHVFAVDRLKRYASSDFKEEALSPGPWGAFATAFTGGASFFGDKAALKALKVGEEHGLKEYKQAIEDTEVSSDLKQVIKTELLPKQENHLRVIERYLQ